MSRWNLTDEQIGLVTQELAKSADRPLAGFSTADLLGRYAAILAELRARDVVRTGNAPLGDYAEYVALDVYGGQLAPNSAKSYDLTASDGRRVQVKARTVGPGTSPSAVFSVFRSFDFDVASLLVLDASSYGLLWAREMTPQQVEASSRWSPHVNGHLLRMLTAERDGIDVTPAYAAVLA
ncbi:hypothetical protein GCM10017690_25890 [Microbacterium terregens]